MRARDPEFRARQPSEPEPGCPGPGRASLPSGAPRRASGHPPQRPHLVNLAEGAVAQLAHDLPHLVGVQVAADVLIFAGLSLLEGRQAQDAAEIGKSHGRGRGGAGSGSGSGSGCGFGGREEKEEEELEDAAALGVLPRPALPCSPTPVKCALGSAAPRAPGTAQAAASPPPPCPVPGAASLVPAPQPPPGAALPARASDPFRGTVPAPAQRPGSTCRSPAEPRDPLIGCGRSPAPPVAAGHSGNCSPRTPRAASRGLGFGEASGTARWDRSWTQEPAGRASWLPELLWERRGRRLGISREPTDHCQRPEGQPALVHLILPQLSREAALAPTFPMGTPAGEGTRPGHTRWLLVCCGFLGAVLPPSVRRAAPVEPRPVPAGPGFLARSCFPGAPRPRSTN